MTAKLFESALGIADPWFVASLNFDEGTKPLTILIDFKVGSHFAVPGHKGVMAYTTPCARRIDTLISFNTNAI